MLKEFWKELHWLQKIMAIIFALMIILSHILAVAVLLLEYPLWEKILCLILFTALIIHDTIIVSCIIQDKIDKFVDKQIDENNNPDE